MLRSHGYAALRMRDIADELSKNKAALHYYDSKHDLLCAFLDGLFGRFVALTDEVEGKPPRRAAGTRRDGPGEARRRPQGVSRPRSSKSARRRRTSRPRERLTRFDDHPVGELTDIPEAGIVDGTFDPTVNPEDTAQFVVTVLTGTATQWVTAGRPAECSQRMLADHVETNLLADPEALSA